MLYEHKKVLKIIIIFVLFSAIFSFLFYKIILVNAELSPIFFQPNHSAFATSSRQSVGNSFTGSFSDFKFSARTFDGNPNPMRVAIFGITTSTFAVHGCTPFSQQDNQWRQPFIFTGTEAEYTFNVLGSEYASTSISTWTENTITKDPNRKWCISFNSLSEYNGFYVYGSPTSTDMISDSAYGAGSSTSTVFSFGLSDAYIISVNSSSSFSTSTSLSIKFPINGSSTNDFLNWSVNIKNLRSLTSSTFRQINVDYSDSDPNVSSTYFTDRLVLDPTFAGEIFLHIPKNNTLLLPNETNRIWYAQARLTETTSTFAYTTATSSIISFNVIRPSTITFFNFGETTSTEAIKHSIFIPFSQPSCSILYGSWTDTYLGIPFFSANAPTRAWCEVQQGLKSLINELVSTMTNFPQKAITAIISLAQNIFPINTIISFNNAIQAAQATTTDVAITIIGQGKIFRNPDGSHRSFVVLASSTTAWIQNSVNFDYKSLFSKIIYLITAGIIIFTTIHIIKSLTHSL